jgi:serine/threonine protein kinase
MGEGLESPALPRPGDVLDGKYRLLRVIGEGGMGVVFEAVHEKLGQHVAIKVLQPSVARNVDLVARFEREARAAGRLRGRNVARVTDVEVSPGQLAYIVMEYLVGHDLDAELSSRAGSRIPVAEAVDLVLQACRAIAEAHAAGIVHRDLKPSNLFLCTEGDERVVKLLDFGVSKMEDEASKLTSTQLVMGTVHYMSPEQVRSAREADTRTDIWALGVILYEVLAGRRPFLGSATAAAVSIVNDEAPPLPPELDVPPGLDAAIRKALAKRLEDRFPDVVAFARAIAPYVAHGTASVVRWMDEVTAVVVVPRGGSDAGLGTARTVHDSASSNSGQLLPSVAASSSSVRETIPTPRPRRLAPRVIAGTAALAVVGALVALAASRSPARAPSAPVASNLTTAVAPALPDAARGPVAPDPLATPAFAPPSTAVAPALVTSAAPTAQPSHPPRASTSASPRPGAAPSPSEHKKEKPPLVAPF